LNRVLGVDAGVSMDAPMESAPVAEQPMAAAASEPMADTATDDGDDEDTLSYFAKLAKE